MTDGVLIGPSTFGHTFVNIKYERDGPVVHHDHAPLANIA
eukprot:CAMPEP_0174347690 /NCGR_PEP_ID=MMETSP0811_2-20130205/3825_1 /TAXON_ID=73025 ORGANISM="Eutreptiella gymnastica-like, Strain CCMP1594" /NCGR_SAMPLE_ID=MMETSP0811_2 /ASSEMBLY_ACC=CAM_ASM_000667 /LENGTH=39 /DNA_ID= /DNA_START= /DNA_END= /DNA_ORIENTATION=